MTRTVVLLSNGDSVGIVHHDKTTVVHQTEMPFHVITNPCLSQIRCRRRLIAFNGARKTEADWALPIRTFQSSDDGVKNGLRFS